MSEIPELDDNYEPTRWTEPIHFVPIAQKLDAATWEQLRNLSNGVTGNWDNNDPT